MIIGPSMGGQISRYALAYMEKQYADTNNPIWKHNTRLWVSVDSPHLGANIPVGAQTLLNVLNDFADSAEAHDFVEDQLGSPAAKQQLIEQHKTEYAPFFPFQSQNVGQEYLNGRTVSQGFSQNRGHPFFIQYYNNLFNNGLANSDGYPQNLRKIALVNGSLTGSKGYDNPYETNGTDFSGTLTPDSFSGNGTKTFKIEGDADVIGHVTNLETYFMPAPNDDHKIAYYKRKKIGGWNYYNRYIFNNNSRGNMDNVPGGWFPTQQELGESIEESVPCDWILFNWPGSGQICVTYWDIKRIRHVNSFIPTASSLGIKNPDFNWAQAFDRNLVCTGEIPFDTYFGPKNNERHTSFTEESVTWLLEELAGNPQLPTVHLDGDDMDGPFVLCGGDTRTYSFDLCQSLPVVDWEVSYNLQIVSPLAGTSGNRSLTVMPQDPSVNGAGYIRANFASPNQPVQKNIWIGPPIVESIEDVSIATTGHTMPIAPINGCDDFGLKLNFGPYFSNVQDMEWEKVTTNYQWSAGLPGNSNEYVVIAPECNGPITFRVRMKNSCGWSNWQELEYEVTQCSSNCGSGGGGGPITTQYFEIYPVPADNNLNVDLIGSSGNLLQADESLSLEIFDINQTSVFFLQATLDQNNIDVSGFNEGQYFLEITYQDVYPSNINYNEVISILIDH